MPIFDRFVSYVNSYAIKDGPNGTYRIHRMTVDKWLDKILKEDDITSYWYKELRVLANQEDDSEYKIAKGTKVNLVMAAVSDCTDKNNHSIVTFSGLVPFDADSCDGRTKEVMDKMKNSDLFMAGWRSLSNKGCHGIVATDQVAKDLAQYKRIASYINESLSEALGIPLDKKQSPHVCDSNRQPTNGLALSYDPEMGFRNDKYTTWDIPQHVLDDPPITEEQSGYKGEEVNYSPSMSTKIIDKMVAQIIEVGGNTGNTTYNRVCYSLGGMFAGGYFPDMSRDEVLGPFIFAAKNRDKRAGVERWINEAFNKGTAKPLYPKKYEKPTRKTKTVKSTKVISEVKETNGKEEPVYGPSPAVDNSCIWDPDDTDEINYDDFIDMGSGTLVERFKKNTRYLKGTTTAEYCEEIMALFMLKHGHELYRWGDKGKILFLRDCRAPWEKAEIREPPVLSFLEKFLASLNWLSEVPDLGEGKEPDAKKVIKVKIRPYELAPYFDMNKFRLVLENYDYPQIDSNFRFVYGTVNDPYYDSTDKVHIACKEQLIKACENPIENIEECKRIIYDEMFGGVVFSDAASKANILPALYHAISLVYKGYENTPMLFVKARNQGSGKTFIIKMIAEFMGDDGYSGVKMNLSPDQQAKAVSSAMQHGSKMICYDNIITVFGDADMASDIVTHVKTERVLGKDYQIRIVNQSFFAGTINEGGNIHKDMERRICLVNIEEFVMSKTETGGDKLKWIRDNRSRIISALTGMLLHWNREGRKPGKWRLKDFEKMTMLVSGIAESCGIYGMGENADEIAEMLNPEHLLITRMYNLWAADEYNRKHGLSAYELVNVMREYGEEEIVEWLTFGNYKETRNVSDHLRKLIKKPFGNWYIAKSDKKRTVTGQNFMVDVFILKQQRQKIDPIETPPIETPEEEF
jgi:hypothetical protein